MLSFDFFTKDLVYEEHSLADVSDSEDYRLNNLTAQLMQNAYFDVDYDIPIEKRGGTYIDEVREYSAGVKTWILYTQARNSISLQKHVEVYIKEFYIKFGYRAGVAVSRDGSTLDILIKINRREIRERIDLNARI